MSIIDELINERKKKLDAIKRAGFLAYPAKTGRTHAIGQALLTFSELSESKEEICLAGRIMAKRTHGKMSFVDIQDGTGKIQVLLKEDKIKEERFKFFEDNFDIGDFVEFNGVLFITKRGEKTIEVTNFRILTKSLRPLPEKWHGIQDIDEKLRKRYLDILFNPEVKEMVEKRSKFWSVTREFMIQKGFMEVETPILENTIGGAEAKPFITHHNALDIEVYLRISPELWLKRLMVAGFPKVFEIGRVFRNEGMDAEHLQDYTHIEFYQAYSDYEKGMELIIEMYRYIADKTFSTLKFKIKDFEIDLGKKWEIYDYADTIKRITGIDISQADLKMIEQKLHDLKVEYDNKTGFNMNRAIDNLWKYCRRQIAGPGFLINVPVMMEPLAKRMESNPNLVERFQVILAGSEVGKGFSELNDPIDQAERFLEQQKLRDQGDEEAQMFDYDFVEALEYGMPPTCGFGVSERLFSFLMNKPMRECQIFPLMRKKDENHI